MLVAWRHQIITRTIVHLSTRRSSDIHLRAILQEVPRPRITEISVKITFRKFHSNDPRVQIVNIRKKLDDDDEWMFFLLCGAALPKKNAQRWRCIAFFFWHRGPISLTHPLLVKMATILADDIFKRIFLNENIRISIQISLKFVPKGPIDNNSALVQGMAWHRTGDKPLPEAMMIQFTDAYMRH